MKSSRARRESRCNKAGPLRSFNVFSSHADDEIGLLEAVRPIAVILVGPLICGFGDKYGSQQRVKKTVPRSTSHLKLCMLRCCAADHRVRRSRGVGSPGY